MKMSLPLSIFISAAHVTASFNLFGKWLCCYSVFVWSCPEEDEVSLWDTWFLFHFCHSSSQQGLTVFVCCCRPRCVSSSMSYDLFRLSGAESKAASKL